MLHIIIHKPITAIRDVDTLVVPDARPHLSGVWEAGVPPASAPKHQWCEGGLSHSLGRRPVEIQVS